MPARQKSGRGNRSKARIGVHKRRIRKEEVKVTLVSLPSQCTLLTVLLIASCPITVFRMLVRNVSTDLLRH